MYGRVFLHRYSQILALTGCTASLGIVIIGRKFTDRFSIYKTAIVKDHKIVFCDDYLRQLLMEVGKKMSISDEDIARVVLYHTKFDGPVYRGCLGFSIHSWLPNVAIGLPMFYQNKYLDDTSYDSLVIDGKTFDIESDSPEGVKFRRQMVLTEDAKKFVLARQLYYIANNVDLIRNCASIATAYVVYQTVFVVSRVIPVVPLLPTASRVLVYSSIAAVLFIIKRELMEVYLSRCHIKADEVARLDSRLHVGAIEFYQKAIKRNKILHNLGFTKEFTKLGNEVSGIIRNYSAMNSHVRLSRLMHPAKEDQ